MENPTAEKKPGFLVLEGLASTIKANEAHQSFKKNQRLQSTSQNSTVIDTFPLLPLLPAEIRLKIWKKASDTSLIIDLWTEYRRCEVNNSVFYHQHYGTKLTDTHSRVLQVNRESRDESLNFLPLEFGTKTIQLGMEVGHDADIRVNWESDVFLPRGYWNLIAFEDFLRQRVGPMQRIAIDPTTSFWTDELKKYISKGVWPFVGVEEVTLYNARGMEVFKPQFINGPIKSPVKLEFVDDAWPSVVITNALAALKDCFDKVEEKKAAGLDHDDSKKIFEAEFLVYVPAFVEDFQRPQLRVMKLVAGSSLV